MRTVCFLFYFKNLKRSFACERRSYFGKIIIKNKFYNLILVKGVVKNNSKNVPFAQEVIKYAIGNGEILRLYKKKNLL